MEKLQEKKYKPGEVAGILQIGNDLLRKYTDHFNIQTDWTQPNSKGHRRYTKQNVEELISITKKIREQNWSWDQVLSWRNGEEEVYFKDYQEKSVLEKKIDQLIEQQQKTNEKLQSQEQFNQALIQKLNENQEENRELKDYIDSSVNKRDQNLLETMNQLQEQKQEKSKSFLSKVFGTKK